MQKIPVTLTAGLAAVLVCNLMFLGLIGSTPDFALYQENGALENMQVLSLALCCGVLAVQYVQCTDTAQRFMLLAALLLVFTFLIRECDLRPYGVSPLIMYFTDGAGRYLLLVPLWLGLTVVVVRNRQARRWISRQLLQSRSGLLLFVSAALLGIGILFDKSVLRMVPSRFYEELFELNAYVFLLLAAVEQRTHRPALL